MTKAKEKTHKYVHISGGMMLGMLIGLTLIVGISAF